MLYTWLGITVVALILEFITADMVTIWFAGGGLVALILSLFDGVSVFVQIPVFIAVSVVCLLCFRKMVMKKLNVKTANLNADSVIGKEYILLTAIGFNQPGSIRVNDVVWSAVTEKETDEIAEKTVVRIIGLKGNKYIVEEVK